MTHNTECYSRSEPRARHLKPMFIFIMLVLWGHTVCAFVRLLHYLRRPVRRKKGRHALSLTRRIRSNVPQI